MKTRKRAIDFFHDGIKKVEEQVRLIQTLSGSREPQLTQGVKEIVRHADAIENREKTPEQVLKMIERARTEQLENLMEEAWEELEKHARAAQERRGRARARARADREREAVAASTTSLGALLRSAGV